MCWEHQWTIFLNTVFQKHFLKYGYFLNIKTCSKNNQCLMKTWRETLLFHINKALLSLLLKVYEEFFECFSFFLILNLVIFQLIPIDHLIIHILRVLLPIRLLNHSFKKWISKTLFEIFWISKTSKTIKQWIIILIYALPFY